MSEPILKLLKPETRWFQSNRLEIREFYRRQGQAAKDHGARERLTRESNITTAPKYRPCPDGCGIVLLWSNPGHHSLVQDPEPEPSEPKAPKAWPQAVSLAQMAWAKRQLQYLDAGGTVDMPREALVALAETDPTGLRERAADKKATKTTPRKRQARSDAL
jgi:hypothetical protein